MRDFFFRMFTFSPILVHFSRFSTFFHSFFHFFPKSRFLVQNASFSTFFRLFFRPFYRFFTFSQNELGISIGKMQEIFSKFRSFYTFFYKSDFQFRPFFNRFWALFQSSSQFSTFGPIFNRLWDRSFRIDFGLIFNRFWILFESIYGSLFLDRFLNHY